MIFLSAGHHLKDPGAMANGLQENMVTIEFRDLIAHELDKIGAKYILDKNDETLPQWLARAQTGSGSVVLEPHCNASSNTLATGIEGLVADNASNDSLQFAAELTKNGAEIIGIKNRGVITESKSARGKLGIMREAGIVCLMEMFFLTNKEDIKKWNAGKVALAAKYASILKKYDDLRQ